MTDIGIMAMEYYLPHKKRKAKEILKEEKIPLGALNKNVDFQKDIGIETVRVSDELPSQLAIKAARKTLEKSGLDPLQIDVVVGFSSLPEDYIGPTWSSAGIVQNVLGLENAFVTGVNTGGCASYHVALKSTKDLMQSNPDINTALLVACDCTPDLNKTYYPITITSDGGGALVLGKNVKGQIIKAVETISIGRLHDVWYVNGIRTDSSDDSTDPTSLHMKCDMEKFNKGVIPINFFMFRKIILSTLERVGMSFEDIDYFVYPSFSTWDQAYFMETMGISKEKVYLKNLKRIGHVQECDMIINYVDAVKDKYIKNGDNVMVVSNGAGFAWSAAIIAH